MRVRLTPGRLATCTASMNPIPSHPLLAIIEDGFSESPHEQN
jgi:hypothetical protein